MTKYTALIVTALLAVSATTAAAQTARYTVEKTDDGYVRMDTQTGQMSVCSLTGNQMVCKMAADERAAFDADIAALQDRVAALERRLGGAGGDVRENDLPTEGEFEQTMDYMERFMNRFMGIVEGFADRDQAEPAPDRT